MGGPQEEAGVIGIGIHGACRKCVAAYTVWGKGQACVFCPSAYRVQEVCGMVAYVV